MADNELDAAIIKATQQALGKYIKKPPLTDKLLKKPPFRFLMDVFNAFIKQTGCFEGLYAAEEQLFENIRDREDKTRYLQKMIDVIKLTTKKELKVRTSKIVAGHEPEHTNELLQLMASVAAQRLDWQSALEQLQSGGSGECKPKESKSRELKTSSSKEETSTDKRLTRERSNEKRISPQQQKQRKPTEKDREQRKEKHARQPKTEKAEKLGSRQSSKQTPSPVKVTKLVKQQMSTESDSKSATPVQQPKPAAAEAPKQESPKASKELDKTLAVTSVPMPIAAAAEAVTVDSESRKSSAQNRSSASSAKSRRSSARQPEELESAAEVLQATPAADSNNNNASHVTEVKREQTFTREGSKDSNGSTQRPRTSLRPPSARPASARPGAPRRRDRNIEIVLQPNDQLKMSGINVKLETFGDFADDGEQLVIIEDAQAHDISAEAATQGATAAMPDLAAAQQGHLVQQILETQKELVQQSTEQAAAKEEQLNMGARQSSARQMNGLREVIQNLSKSVHPFGKLMDFIPEHMDAMQLELSMWRNSYAQASSELKRERQLTESATQPIKHQLLQIEGDIREYLELIDASRHKILQNNERLLKLLMEQ